MELVPWRPFREVGSLRQDLEEIWKRFFSEPLLTHSRIEKWTPPVDILETEAQIMVKIELPGLEAQDVDVRVAGDLLTLKGEKKGEECLQEHQFHNREICAGAFQRSLRLPARVQGDKVEAKFKDGVLSIVLPKVRDVEKKKIEIDV